MTATIGGDARHRIAAEAVGVLRVVKVAGPAFGRGVELDYAGIRADPQISAIVLGHCAHETAADAREIVRVVSGHHERVAIVAVETLGRAQPHEAVAILHDGDDIALRQAIIGGEAPELEIARG
jgi:hypothetical protein